MDVSVERGLVSVTGPNGAGKTTLLRAVAYALTGMVDGDWGDQSSLQKDGEAVPGYVEVVCACAGESPMTIRRSCTPSTKVPDTVTVDGKVVAQRRKTVDEYLEARFGVPLRLLFQTVWGRQGQLSLLLCSPAAYVSSFLAQVFDTRRLEKLRERLKEAVDTVPLHPADVKARCEAIRELLRKMPEELEAASSEVSSLEGELDAAEADMKKLDGVSGATYTESRRGEELAEASRKLEELKALLDALTAVPEGVEVQTLPLDRAVELKKFADDTVKALEAESGSLSDRIAERDSGFAVLDGQIKAAEDRLDSESDRLYAGHAGCCELCGAPLEDYAAYSRNAVRMVTGFGSEKEWEDARKKELDELRRRRDELEADTGKLVARREEIEGRELPQAQSDSTLCGLAVLKAKRMDLLSARGETEERIAELKAVPTVPDDLYNRREELRDRLLEVSRRLTDARVLYNDARTRERMLKEALERREVEAKLADRDGEVRAVLCEIRDMMSQQRGQARYMKGRIADFNARLSECMEMTGLPFRLRLDENRRVFVYDQDGYEHPAAHLSGAQRSMSALAIQMAMMQTVSRHLALYMVDEPAEALDPSNKRVMADMLGRLAGMEGSMLIVTRDLELIAQCGSNIEVGAG